MKNTYFEEYLQMASSELNPSLLLILSKGLKLELVRLLFSMNVSQNILLEIYSSYNFKKSMKKDFRKNQETNCTWDITRKLKVIRSFCCLDYKRRDGSNENNPWKVTSTTRSRTCKSSWNWRKSKFVVGGSQEAK